MTGQDYGQLGYLVLLGSVIAGYFLVANRNQLGKMAQQAAVWGLIFLGAIAAAGLWGDIRSTVPGPQAMRVGEGRIEVPRSPDGHYYLRLGLNGTPVDFIVDTGATDMVLSAEDAARIGIEEGSLRFLGRAVTANGEIRTAATRIDEVRLGGFLDRDVPARVSGGEMPGSLLGMGYLSRFTELSISGGRLTLVR